MYKINKIVGVFALCLFQQAQAGEIAVKNWNCVWQGLSRTNQAKFRIWRWGWPAPPVMGTIRGAVNIKELPRACSDVWITVHVGKTQTAKVVPAANERWAPPGAIEPPRDVAGSCLYAVQAEGVIIGAQASPVDGQNNSRFVCRLDWAGVCQCQTE